jgi:hypothetical protein
MLKNQNIKTNGLQIAYGTRIRFKTSETNKIIVMKCLTLLSWFFCGDVFFGKRVDVEYLG